MARSGTRRIFAPRLLLVTGYKLETQTPSIHCSESRKTHSSLHICERKPIFCHTLVCPPISLHFARNGVSVTGHKSTLAGLQYRGMDPLEFETAE